MNALDWYHENYCQHCDRPGTTCLLKPQEKIACILAAILYELTTQAE